MLCAAVSALPLHSPQQEVGSDMGICSARGQVAQVIWNDTENLGAVMGLHAGETVCCDSQVGTAHAEMSPSEVSI